MFAGQCIGAAIKGLLQMSARRCCVILLGIGAGQVVVVERIARVALDSGFVDSARASDVAGHTVRHRQLVRNHAAIVGLRLRTWSSIERALIVDRSGAIVFYAAMVEGRHGPEIKRIRNVSCIKGEAAEYIIEQFKVLWLEACLGEMKLRTGVAVAIKPEDVLLLKGHVRHLCDQIGSGRDSRSAGGDTTISLLVFDGGGGTQVPEDGVDDGVTARVSGRFAGVVGEEND